MNKPDIKIQHYLWLGGLTFVAYFPSLLNGFIWDDFLSFAHNPFVQHWSNLKYLFSKEYFLLPMDVFHIQNWGSAEGVYRPVTTLTYFWDYALKKLNPTGYHFSNILLHIITSFLVFRFLVYWTKNVSSALIGALVFALHPIQVEAVGVISMRDDVLAGLFYMLSVNVYLEGRKKGVFSAGLYAAMLGSFVLAVFSKEMAFTLPVMLWVVEYFYSGKKFLLKDVFQRRYWGIYLIALVSFWIWGVVMKKGYGVGYPEGSLWVNFLTMIKVMGIYAGWIVNPPSIYHTLYADGNFYVRSVMDIQLWWSGMIVATWVILFVWISRSIKQMPLAIVWTLVALSPAMNIVPMENIMAARFLYLPFVGAAIAAALVWDRVLEKEGQWFFSLRMFRMVLVAVMCFWIITLYGHQLRLKDNFSLARHWVDVYPEHPKSRASLAWMYFYDRHDAQKALEQARIAQHLNTRDCEVDHSLAKLFHDLNHMDEAIVSMRRTLACDPDSHLFMSNLCAYYGIAQRYQEAALCFEDLVDLDASVTRSYYDLQYTYLLMKKPEKSVRTGFRALWQWQKRLHDKGPK